MPDATFEAVAAVAPTDVWAVAMKGKRPVVVRWNGRSWRTAPAPRGPLESISASASGVWAVGGNSVWTWTGTNWRRLPSPRLPAARGAWRPESLSLSDVVAVSPTDLWVVGTVDESNGGIVERWDGRRWRVVEALDGDSAFDAVAAARPDRLWAVGAWWRGAYVARLVGRWNGTQWETIADLPDVGTDEGDYEDNFLLDVDARRPDDVWAVGGNLERPFVEHWNGRVWSHAHTGARGVLNAVAAVAKWEAWAVGEVSGAPLIVHRTSRGWRAVPSPTRRGALVAIDALSPSSLWAVGGGTILRYGC